jgi:hypothetical protein
MKPIQQAAHGIIEGDCIKLLEPLALADGTLVEVTVTVPARSEGARERQRILLRDGIHLGGPPYPTREDLHDR